MNIWRTKKMQRVSHFVSVANNLVSEANKLSAGASWQKPAIGRLTSASISNCLRLLHHVILLEKAHLRFPYSFFCLSILLLNNVQLLHIFFIYHLSMSLTPGPYVFAPATGWSNWTEIIFDLITPDRRHPMKWDRCPFSHYIWTFWYIVSKNSNRLLTIFTDWCIGGVL